ncbi:YppF family protein [Virgibacillus kimchii]
MLISELVDMYQNECNHTPASVNDLLDYYQRKYINDEIDITYYREIYMFLSRQGAISAHEKVSYAAH